MKLYDLIPGSFFRISDPDPRIPPGALEPTREEVYKFVHVDGMYAPVSDTTGEVYYLAAWTEVTPLVKTE
jgi:hypothetical protein